MEIGDSNSPNLKPRLPKKKKKKKKTGQSYAFRTTCIGYSSSNAMPVIASQYDVHLIEGVIDNQALILQIYMYM